MELLASISLFLMNHGAELVGFALPPIIDLANRDIPQDKELTRFAIAVLICFLAAAILDWDKLIYGSPEQLLASFAMIFTESQVVYKAYFKDSFLRGQLLQRVQKDTPPQQDSSVG